MPIFRTVPLYVFLVFKLTAFAVPVLDNWFASSMVQRPIRIEQLEGDKIVELSKFQSSAPLIFPKSVSLFERMDASLPRFYTLNELAKNPGIKPFYKFHSNSIISPPQSFIEDSPEISLSEREKQLFDTSLLLVPRNSNPLPSDEQLQAFLEEGRKKFTPPVDPKEIIDNLLKHEFSDHPVVSLLNESPEVKKALKSESFNQSTVSLFNSASLALNHPQSVSQDALYEESIPAPPTSLQQYEVEQPAPSYGSTSLKLQARKPSRDGTLKPAQASEIYLTTQDLKELLKDLSKDPVVAGEVRSVAELWAKAEKNDSRNPEIALGVKSILLSAKVGRARTDPYGQASMENLSPDDKYYVIGIDKDEETDVVTIWSKEVEVSPGENLVELTSTDVIYQE